MRSAASVVVRGIHDLAAFRHALATCLDDAEVSREVAADVQLAASELVTNGLTHGGAETVDVKAVVFDDRIELTVRHGDDPGAARPNPVSTRHDRGGRGLAILRHVSSFLSIDHHHGARTTWVVFARTFARSRGWSADRMAAAAGAR